MQRIGIFGGAFDPIHLGHTRVMRNVLDKSRVDEILIVPNGVPPYRTPTVDMSHLRSMVAIAVEGMPKVSIVEQAMLRGTKNTLDVVRAIIRRHPGAFFTYIIGADKLAGLLHWAGTPQLFAACDLLVYPRAGYNGQELTQFAAAQGYRAQLLPVPPVNTSSSLVRAQIGLLSDAEDMIFPQVARYIALKGLYKPAYEQQVCSQMNQRRFEHTLGVRNLAVDLALQHGASMQQAAVASVLHDVAKCMKLGQLQAIARKYGLTDDPQVLRSNALLHGKVGAVLASAKYGVHNPDVLNAIRYHTTGRTNMSPVELCVFVADAAEPGRSDYPGLSEIRAMMWHDLRRAALLSMLGTRRHVEAQGEAIGQDAAHAIQYLENILQRDDMHHAQPAYHEGGY